MTHEFMPLPPRTSKSVVLVIKFSQILLDFFSYEIQLITSVFVLQKNKVWTTKHLYKENAETNLLQAYYSLLQKS